MCKECKSIYFVFLTIIVLFTYVCIKNSNLTLVWFAGSHEGTNDVAISKDGKKCANLFQLEKEKDREFSYPAIIQTSDQSIHITYTARRKTIKHAVININ